jgi:hypothetical protein
LRREGCESRLLLADTLTLGDAYKNLTGKIGDKVVKKWFSDLRLLHMHENLLEARTMAVRRRLTEPMVPTICSSEK